MIPDHIDVLTRLHQGIQKWEALAADELRAFAKECEAAPEPSWENYGYDPVTEEAFMLHRTERAMFATLAVAIASTTEDLVGLFCDSLRIKPDRRPNWGNRKQALERTLKLRFDDLPGFALNKRARLLGNCFKHRSGKTDTEFVKGLGGEGGVEI